MISVDTFNTVIFITDQIPLSAIIAICQHSGIKHQVFARTAVPLLTTAIFVIKVRLVFNAMKITSYLKTELASLIFVLFTDLMALVSSVKKDIIISMTKTLQCVMQTLAVNKRTVDIN